MNDKDFAAEYYRFRDDLARAFNGARLPLVVKLSLLQSLTQDVAGKVARMMQEPTEEKKEPAKKEEEG